MKVEFTKEKLERLKTTYEDKLKAGKKFDDVFELEGNLYVMGYAKYLIEYLQGRFKQ